MKKLSTTFMILLLSAILIFSKCTENKPAVANSSKDSSIVSLNTGSAGSGNGGYESQAKWGEHLVKITGCGDCHSPKMMTATGPQDDPALAFSGHPSKIPPPDVDRKAMETKGLAATSDQTAWVGPWGISYAANLTPDSTGLGNWTEAQFILCLRKGKWKGIEGGRDLLPPMPSQSSYKYLTDDELKAIFAYLKTVKPVNNVEPAAVPPLSAGKK